MTASAKVSGLDDNLRAIIIGIGGDIAGWTGLPGPGDRQKYVAVPRTPSTSGKKATGDSDSAPVVVAT